VTAGAQRGAFRLRVGGRIGIGVLLEQGHEEVLAQLQSPLLALVESDERLGLVGGEHQVEGRRRLVEELLSELFAAGASGTRGVVHDGSSRVTDHGLGLYYSQEPGAATGMDPLYVGRTFLSV
jgi:hypothetical protein